MLTGLPPHFSRDKKEMKYKIAHAKLKFPYYLSKEVTNLLKGLLQKDPSKRIG